jgi:hypothetical protein
MRWVIPRKFKSCSRQALSVRYAKKLDRKVARGRTGWFKVFTSTATTSWSSSFASLAFIWHIRMQQPSHCDNATSTVRPPFIVQQIHECCPHATTILWQLLDTESLNEQGVTTLLIQRARQVNCSTLCRLKLVLEAARPFALFSASVALPKRSVALLSWGLFLKCHGNEEVAPPSGCAHQFSICFAVTQELARP